MVPVVRPAGGDGLITALVTVWFLLEMVSWLTDAYRGYQITPGTTPATDVPAGTAVIPTRTISVLGMQEMRGFHL